MEQELKAQFLDKIDQALGKIDDDTYPAKCMLKFTAAVFRELCCRHGFKYDPAFNCDELQGLALVMEVALHDIDTALGLGNDRATATGELRPEVTIY